MTSVERFQTVGGVRVPSFLYGTAWKEARTLELAALALASGFRGLDTANQRRHYVESAVGDAVAAFVGEGAVSREELFLQTKFTSVGGQDKRLPYDARADPATQVRQSFDSSLEHLHTTYIDSYLLHGPSSRLGISETDWAEWRAMEELQRAGRARLLGISNVSLAQLRTLHDGATVKPAFVQNRCYANEGWDRDVRGFCTQRGIVYQGFSLLTANARELEAPAVRRAADRTSRTLAQVVFRFALQLGMIPLTGTTSQRHMLADLACFDFELEPAEMKAIERVAGG